MAGLVSKTTSDFTEFFEVQIDGWWMWVAGVLRATGDSIERICANTWGVSSGGRIPAQTAEMELPVSSHTSFHDKEIVSRFTKLG